MDNRIIELLKDETNPDNGRVLIGSLISMLRTGKAGLLDNSELRYLLANRFEKALNAKADEVSDALCITRGHNKSRYGNAEYDFMLWYFKFIEEKKKPTSTEILNWIDYHPVIKKVNADTSESHLTYPSSTVNKWIRRAKDSYEPFMKGLIKTQV